jgi:hypothetical protein
VASLDELVAEWLTLPDLAEVTGQSLSALRELERQGRLVSIRRGDPPVAKVPADLVHDGELVRGLGSALMVLGDAGLQPAEALTWLLTPDDVLGGRPVDLMAAGRDVAVRRQAMTLAL